MAAKNVVTFGFGFADGVKYIPTLGFGFSQVIAGPYYTDRAQIFAPGSVGHEVYSAGAVQHQQYAPGAVAVEVTT